MRTELFMASRTTGSDSVKKVPSPSPRLFAAALPAVMASITLVLLLVIRLSAAATTKGRVENTTLTTSMRRSLMLRMPSSDCSVDCVRRTMSTTSNPVVADHSENRVLNALGGRPEASGLSTQHRLTPCRLYFVPTPGRFTPRAGGALRPRPDTLRLASLRLHSLVFVHGGHVLQVVRSNLQWVSALRITPWFRLTLMSLARDVSDMTSSMNCACALRSAGEDGNLMASSLNAALARLQALEKASRRDASMAWSSDVDMSRQMSRKFRTCSLRDETPPPPLAPW
mmetsp:Transcript_63356/g.150150  ORF Transcript_63356/g.150150 Transcript_63356/m.150150 type:complete len:284 (+) Transcript_63356:262-1113(+)